MENLLKPENKEKFKALLLMHVVPEDLLIADVKKIKDAKAAGGAKLEVTHHLLTGVYIGTPKEKAHVQNSDIHASNGVVRATRQAFCRSRTEGIPHIRERDSTRSFSLFMCKERTVSPTVLIPFAAVICGGHGPAQAVGRTAWAMRRVAGNGSASPTERASRCRLQVHHS